MRYSLRTLAIAIAILAAVLGTWVQYRRVTMCHIRWLQPGSPEAAALVPASHIEAAEDGWYRMTYYPSHRRIQSLLAATRIGSNYRLNVLPRESVEVVSEEEAMAAARLKALHDADFAKPGLFVIRGRVIDRAGKPLADATVDLMGPYVFINHFQTRSDGTFIMSLEDVGTSPPAGAGYYLRVRSAYDKESWHSSTFDLDLAVPERDAIITVPR